jgi:hypothetical protein
MKSVLNRNPLLNAKQSFFLSPGGLLVLTSCGEWTSERGEIEMEDHTKRGNGINEAASFDIEFDLGSLPTKNIILKWWYDGIDQGAKVPGGSAKGVSQDAYRNLVRTYHSHYQDRDPSKDTYVQQKAINCYIKSLGMPPFEMKSTDVGKAKISIICDDYEWISGDGQSITDTFGSLSDTMKGYTRSVFDGLK